MRKFESLYLFICITLFLFLSTVSEAQIPKGLYIGYQAATVPGGINNLRAMVGSENIRYQSQTKEMKYTNLLHGISAGWIIRSKNPLFKNGTYMEFNWNGLQNFYTAKGTNSDSLDYTSRYKIRMNGLNIIVGFPFKEKYSFKTGIHIANFDIFYKGSLADKFDATDYKNVTDPEGFPEPFFHFGLDMPVSSGVYLRTFINLPIDLTKELGYLYNLTHCGFQLFVPLKQSAL